MFGRALAACSCTAALMWTAPAHAARPVPAPPLPLEVKAEGVVVTGTVRDGNRQRYRVVLPAKGTLIVSLSPIHGRLPRALLRNAEGKVVRRDKNGQLWTRTPPGEELVLEVSARAGDGGGDVAPSTYALRTVFDVDRPRAEREQRRPARPGDVVSVPSHGRVIERVLVDGILADYVEAKGGVLVTVPAFAQSGVIELVHDTGAKDTFTLALIGAARDAGDFDGGGCGANDGVEVAGCIRVVLAPAVGDAWLAEIARIVDADVAAHAKKAGIAVLKLRIPSSDGFALATLRAMPGVRDARS